MTHTVEQNSIKQATSLNGVILRPLYKCCLFLLKTQDNNITGLRQL